MSRALRGVVDAAARVVLALGVVGTVGAALGELSWVLALATHFRLHMVAALIPVAVLALAGRRYRGALLAVVLVVVNAAAMAPAWSAAEAPAAEPPRGQRLRIVYLNVQQPNRDHGQVADYLREAEPDVVVLAEVDGPWVRALGSELDGWPHRAVHERVDCFGLAVFSRVPLRDNQIVATPAEVKARWLRVSLDVEGPDLTLVGLHALPPLGEEWVEGTRALLGSLSARRADLAERAVVCGDFNLTPWSADYRRFVEETSLREVGASPRGTWPSSVPLLRLPIDHCLTSPDLTVVGLRVGPHVGSDHRPIVLDVVL
ncbi:MAG: endonuclease/exonuclease/phosphatase family protein [Myxococcota bacterium]